MTFYRRTGKRLLDVALVLAALPLLIPLSLLVVMLVRLTIGRGVLFNQLRPGQGGVPFLLRKFRTMREDPGGTLSDADRMTPFGRLLRSTSLDELPELLNVLRGEMSLVGPRPLLMRYLERYTPQQARRHEVRPGLTGWAQVNGRNALTWERKFELDVWYVDHVSLWLDLRIIALTLWRLVTREGVSQPGQATAEEFLGSPPSC
jgi:lipopolysaccharide/colanic/teichoic acid biosynthesis glycosyltransferase